MAQEHEEQADKFKETGIVPVNWLAVTEFSLQFFTLIAGWIGKKKREAQAAIYASFQKQIRDNKADADKKYNELLRESALQRDEITQLQLSVRILLQPLH